MTSDNLKDEQQRVAEMRAAQAARVAEYKAAEYERRERMEEALRPRMKEAGDRPEDIKYCFEEFTHARSEVEQNRLYAREEARLTTWETNRAVHQLKAEASLQREATLSQPERVAEATHVVARKETATGRVADDGAHAEQQRKMQNERAQGVRPSGTAEQQVRPRRDEQEERRVELGRQAHNARMEGAQSAAEQRAHGQQQVRPRGEERATPSQRETSEERRERLAQHFRQLGRQDRERSHDRGRER